MEPAYDVAIIGGGPAGSTAATLLARAGRTVIVLEREKFPRFHIGESLLPYSMAAFDRLGLREKMDAAFQPKHGGEISTACGTRSLKFYFKDGFRLKHHRAYQVMRADFDKMLLDHAAENGAHVMEETTVENPAFDDGGVTLTIRRRETDGHETLRARYLIDASGRNSVVGSFLKLRQSYTHLQKFSVFAHFEGVVLDEGIDRTLTRLIRSHDRWFWIIPVTETRTSVGVVMDSATFKKIRQSPEDALEQSLREQPVMQMRMRDAARVSPVYSAGDYSYRNARFTGDRWMLAGDAAGFIDPIFSTGVFLAILSGEQSADTLHAILDNPRRRPRLFARYEKSMNRVMDMYLRFVNAWYRHEFTEVFSNPTSRFQLAPAINAVLAGNLGGSFAIWWRLQLFYLVLFLQRRIPLCPRLTLKPETP